MAHLPLALAAALAVTGPAPAPPVHRMNVELRGPLALVTVERSLALQGGAADDERVLDLALPEGAALVGWEADGGDRGRLRLSAVAPEAPAREDHGRALMAVGAAATKIPLEEGTDVRLHLGGLGGRRAVVRYRYSAPLACRQGRFVLDVPGSLEPEPVPAEVTVQAAGLRVVDLVVAGARGIRTTRAPARAGWQLSFAVPGKPAQLLAALGRRTLAVGACASAEPTTSPRPAPERVLLLIDRSRSVGPAGIVLERDLARALALALPPSVRFNAVFFDRQVTPLFALPRAATTEALDALVEQAGPGQLQNGTDLAAALRLTTEMARAERSPTWVVLVTDGALPEEQTAAGLLAAAAGLPADSRVLVLVVRPPGDEPPGPGSLASLRALPGRFGGVLRMVDPADLRAAAEEVVAATRQGGDLFALTVTAQGLPFEALGMLERGGGRARVLPWAEAHLPARATVRHDGAAVPLALHAATVDGAWLAALGGPRRGWRAESPRLAAWVEPGPTGERTPGATDPQALARGVWDPVKVPAVDHGEMDRGVVRNALSLAYLPRARACYLNRRVEAAADFDLRGRLRLELTLERGEMLAAVVRSSTLGRPAIERCLRDAAFGLEIPRPLHRDAPVVAALNLQFQPSTPKSTSPPDASPLQREIDLIVSPVLGPGSADPMDLLASPADSGKTPASPPPGRGNP